MLELSSSSNLSDKGCTQYKPNLEVIKSKKMKAYFAMSIILEVVCVIIIMVIACTFHITNTDNCLMLFYMMGALQLPVFILHCITELLAHMIGKYDSFIVRYIVRSQFYQHWSIVITIFTAVLLEGISFGVGKTCYDYIDKQDQEHEKEEGEGDFVIDDGIPSCKYIEYGDTSLLLILVIAEFLSGLIFKIPTFKVYFNVLKGKQEYDESDLLFIDGEVGNMNTTYKTKGLNSKAMSKCSCDSCLMRKCKHSIYHNIRARNYSLTLSKTQAQTIKALQEENKKLAEQILRAKENNLHRNSNEFNVQGHLQNKDNANSNTAVLNSLCSRISLEINDLNAKITQTKENIAALSAEEQQLRLQLAAERELQAHAP